MTPPRVPFVDLAEQYGEIKADLEGGFSRLFASMDFVLGSEVESFEAAFADYLGVEHVVGVGSGTEALHLALLEAGVGPGDEVLVPANTFIATALAVAYTGAVPVPVDVEESSFNIDPARAEEAVTGSTRAVLPVHLYGRCAPMDDILDLAASNDLVVVEDACQAHGAGAGGRKAGAMSRSGCFSFYPGKNLGACGDGGAVATNDPGVAERLRLLRNYGQREKNVHEVMGFNSRLDSMQAVVLGVKLKRLDGWNGKRREAAALYDELLSGRVKTPEAPAEEGGHVYHIYAARVSERDAVRERLDGAGVATGVHYPVPFHLQPCFAHLGYGPGDFPVTERLASEELSLPMYPEIGPERVRYAAESVIKAVGKV